MRRRAGFCLALACCSGLDVGAGFSRPSQALSSQSSISSDLDLIFSDPILSRALVGARVESLRDGRVLYARNDDKHVMPASNMKLVTLAVAAERLGWDFRFETRLETTGTVADGVLHGDLVVVGGGDPSIGSLDAQPAPLFFEWARLLRQAGIRRIDGRLIGDDNAFDDEGLGRGWSWDDLGEGYAAPTGALSFNENSAVLRVHAGAREGDPATLGITPPGHGLQLINELKTGAAGLPANIDAFRLRGQSILTARGTVPAGNGVFTHHVSVDNPTRFFLEDFRSALTVSGIQVSGGAWVIDDVPTGPGPESRRLIDRHMSAPLSSLAGYFMKVSQNFYAETFVKALGRAATNGAGTTAAGRQVVLDTLASWGVPSDAIVFVDGSGLSRYNYVTPAAIIVILKRMWSDEQSRGPFAASLPVAGHDGTLENRMKGNVLDARVQAKTGTISNVRSLSGYLETKTGNRLVFSIIANHFTAPSSQVDAVVERALTRLARE